MMTKKSLLQLIYPSVCTVCGEIISAGSVCGNCSRLVTSRTVSNGITDEGIPFLGLYSSEEIKKLVLAMKKERNAALFDYAAGLCAENLRLRISGIDEYIVTYLPRRLSARLSAGLDQSCVLAKCIAQKLFIPFEKTLSRRMFTLEQKRLSKEARRANVAGIFSAAADVSHKRFILIDDVTTTGSSLLSASGALYDGGAENVIPFAFAGK